MFDVLIYETERGNAPLRKYYDNLIKEHKQDELNVILAFIKRLELCGKYVNNRYPNTSKKLYENIHELRPKKHRVIYFFFDKYEAYLLHAFRKKSQETPQLEIRNAVNERNDYLRRN